MMMNNCTIEPDSYTFCVYFELVKGILHFQICFAYLKYLDILSPVTSI